MAQAVSQTCATLKRISALRRNNPKEPRICGLMKSDETPHFFMSDLATAQFVRRRTLRFVLPKD